MEPEWMIMRMAYIALFITLALMSWAYMVQAEILAQPLVADSFLLSASGHQANVLDVYPPCSFNSLCTCSKPGPTEFGIVACHDVPFGNIPESLNSSRAFCLSMVGNNLLVLEEKRLVGSGLWKLQVNKNNLNFIADDAFVGLSKFLSELDLNDNLLTTIPTVALQALGRNGKLKILNVGNNRITDVNTIDFVGLPTSITRLGLEGNMITSIQEDVFAHLPNLEEVDLSDNSIQFLHSHSFYSVSRTLKHLYLKNNLFKMVPFEALGSLKLKVLDVSHNLLTSISDILEATKITVGIVNFQYNQITVVPSFAFQNFKIASIVNLSWNPIEAIMGDAFKSTKMAELYISNCYIKEIDTNAFRGTEATLETLDLSSNNISELPVEIFKKLDNLRQLKLDQNIIQDTSEVLLNQNLFGLHKLSVIGPKMSIFNVNYVESAKNLRGLSISNIGTASVRPELFEGFSYAIEEVKLSQGKLISIQNGAFSPLTGLHSIDLSENKIEKIDNFAFDGVGHSLTRLIMHDSTRMTTFPAKAFNQLTAIRHLDLSSNMFSNFPDSSFDEMERLLYLNLRFNRITKVSKHLFDCNKVPMIQRLFLSFNNIKEINKFTFYRLKYIEFIELNENIIEVIHQQAFVDLINLRILNLSGNRIKQLKDEAFQNLPRLQILDFSHNRLVSVNMDAFEQLGTLSSFRISFSHNNIQSLEEPKVEATPMRPVHHFHDGVMVESEISQDEEEANSKHEVAISSSSIETIDLSNNNISFIEAHFFAPISNTIIDLDLSNNRLKNLSLEHLSGMKFIHYLKMSNNLLDSIEYNTFRSSPYIQILDFNNNLLRDLSPDLFEGCVNLRVLHATDNKIRALPDSIFKDTQIEVVNMRNNQLVRFPENAVSHVAFSLVHLDLSGNEITSLTDNQIECLQKVRWLDLSNNRIVVLSESTFDRLHSLIHLDMSGNQIRKISARMFEEIRDNILHIHLANMSLETLPEFDTFSKLLTLNASSNELTFLPTNFGVKIVSLRTLDISGNHIPASPNTIWHTIPRLSHVLIKNNPIRSLTNDSFLQLERVQELDLSELPLESVQAGLFFPLGCLKKLTIGPLTAVFDAGALLHNLRSLQHLHLKIETPLMALELRSHPLPPKVSSITVSGHQLLSIIGGSFDDITGRRLKLTFDDTGLLNDVADDVLQNIGEATQLSVKFQGDNSALRIISNPNPNFSKGPFNTVLEEIEFGANMSISCSCETGWIEFWLRQWMETTCPIVSASPKDESQQCNSKLESIRNVRCQNKPGMDLLHAFIVDLECGWQNSSYRVNIWNNLIPLCFVLAVLTQIM